MIQLLLDQPVLAVFLVIGTGYALGRLRVAGVQLGTSTCVLLGGLLLGHFGVHGSSGSQSVGFILFIYCVGLRAGPQFFTAFRKNGIQFALLAAVVAAVGVGTAVLLSQRLDLPPGFRAGLLAGALTSTPTLVAAQDAVRDGAALLPAGFAPEAALRNIAASYAITYVVGLFGLLILVALLPRIMGIDLAAEARRLAAQRPAGEVAPASERDRPVMRVYQVTAPALVGASPAELLQRTGCLAQRLRRGDIVLEVRPETCLELGDLVSMLGPRAMQRRALEQLGGETVDDELLEVAEQRTILVTGGRRPRRDPGQAEGDRTLATATSANAAGLPYTVAMAAAFGAFVVGLQRAGMRLPLSAELALQKGDLLIVVGLPRNLDALAERIGQSQAPADEADLITFAFGIAAGIAIGLVNVHVGGIPIGLGTAGGLLLSGLVVGYLRTIHPTFGQLSVGATSVLMELGLQFFMANIGLEAGGTIVEALYQGGPWLPLGAFVVMGLPLLLGFALGRLVLGLDPVILLGALTGSMTSTPALDMVNRQADSPLPTVGYAGTYAFANVLLAIAGALLMRL